MHFTFVDRNIDGRLDGGRVYRTKCDDRAAAITKARAILKRNPMTYSLMVSAADGTVCIVDRRSSDAKTDAEKKG